MSTENSKDLDAEAVLALSEEDESLSVEAVKPKRANSKYAILPEGDA
ncbi:hypothetical protein [Streptomyces sp. NPDC046909]